MDRKTINLLFLLTGYVIGGFTFGFLCYIGGSLSGAEDARLAERERDLAVIFSEFEKCADDAVCEDKYRYAYFALRSDQQLRDGRDALERIYKERPDLRPVETKQ